MGSMPADKQKAIQLAMDQIERQFGKGISTAGDLLDMAVQRDVIDKSGAWYSFDKERIGQGRESAKDFLKEHPDVSARVLENLRDALGLVQKETKGPEAELAHREIRRSL